MDGLERRWLLEGAWKLQVLEDSEGWSILEPLAQDATGDRPVRWSDATGAFGAACDEFRLAGSSGTWDVRVYRNRCVMSASPVPGGRLRIPDGWWREETGEGAGASVGLGRPGTSSRDLERSERRGWEAWIEPRGVDASEPRTFSIVERWHRHDETHGDTEFLHGMAPIGGEALLREALRNGASGPVALALDCRDLDVEEHTEDHLADGFLFAHQAFGARWLCWNAPPSAKVVRALERAHMDAQGELFGVWVARGEPLPSRAPWRRLGPVLRRGESEADCYVWER